MAEPIPFLNEIEWRDMGHEPTTEGHWLRNQSLPHDGETRWTASIFLKTVQAGNRLWFLFEPGAAVFNGLSNEPSDMDEAAVVEVEVLERRVVGPVVHLYASSPTDRDYSWIQVRCLRVIPLWDIPNHLEETSPVKEFDRLPKKSAESDKIVEFEARAEELIDSYYLTKTTPPRVVLNIGYFGPGRVTVILNSAFELPDPR